VQRSVNSGFSARCKLETHIAGKVQVLLCGLIQVYVRTCRKDAELLPSSWTDFRVI
jgi:hypothetical protein